MASGVSQGDPHTPHFYLLRGGLLGGGFRGLEFRFQGLRILGFKV